MAAARVKARLQDLAKAIEPGLSLHRKKQLLIPGPHEPWVILCQSFERAEKVLRQACPE